MRQRRRVFPGPAFGFALVAYVIVRGIQELGAVVFTKLTHFRVAHCHIAIGQGCGDGLVVCGQAVQAMGYRGGGRRAVMDAFKQAGISREMFPEAEEKAAPAAAAAAPVEEAAPAPAAATPAEEKPAPAAGTST